jgi:hypothetical protein
MRARDRILDMFGDYHELTVKEIVERTSFTKQMIHYAINQLLRANKIERIGHTPSTIYRRIATEIPDQYPECLRDKGAELDEFAVVTETGELLEGTGAFVHWCSRHSQPPAETLNEYRLLRERGNRYDNVYGMVDGHNRLQKIMGPDNTWLNELYYLDYDTMGRFGKTRLGTLVNHSKHGRSRELMGVLMKDITPRIEDFLRLQRPEAVAFVPPVISREVQLMTFIQSRLSLPLPIVNIRKISGKTAIPQNSIPNVKERIINSDCNFSVSGHHAYGKIVLIDDAVDSGATLNQIAYKIKHKHLAYDVAGLAIVGNLEGFTTIAQA